MKNLTEFLAKFEAITFNNTDEDKAIMGSFRGHEIKISYQLKVDTFRYEIYAVVNIFVDGQRASGWGCIDAEENSVALQWIHERMNKALAMKMKEEKYKREQAERLLESLV